jgi:hypothetical protein
VDLARLVAGLPEQGQGLHGVLARGHEPALPVLDGPEAAQRARLADLSVESHQ